MFVPPFCPYPGCSSHTRPRSGFYKRHGSYHPNCRPRPVPRYRCRCCNRTFSRQTFRLDFRDHRPQLNRQLFDLTTSGVGIRQSARLLGLSLRCTELKLRKLGRHAGDLNRNLSRPLLGCVRLHLDEIETFEADRRCRPLTVPIVLSSETRYILWAKSAPIRPRGMMTPERLERIERSNARHGPRTDRSRAAVRSALTHAARLAKGANSITLYTDEKLTYPVLAVSAFGSECLVHHRTNSHVARTTRNPLFPINHEEAIVRDLMGRLRRRSWLASKVGRYLNLALQVHMVYRNLVRRRFNKDTASPAQLEGLLPRRLTPCEVLSWRQDWGVRSVHPLSTSGGTIQSWNQRLDDPGSARAS